MALSLRELRRRVTQFAIRNTIKATANLPIDLQRSIIGTSIVLSGKIPLLRWRVRETMRLALGDGVPRGAEDRYFIRLAWFYANALSAFHHGLMATAVPHQIAFDDSVRHLDDAMAEGRGVILVSSHWAGHELVGAMIGRRHPMVMLVRQASTPEQMTRKLKWYEALGADIVLRPKRASTIKDAVAYLKVLKGGKLLAITPDLLADGNDGKEVRIFGRVTRLPQGAFAFAAIAQAPMVRLYLRWQSDSRVTARFERAPAFNTGDRDADIRAAMLNWCQWFEEELRTNPENWSFWLDKRWSRFLRSTPRSLE